MNNATAKSFFWSFLEQGGSKAIALVVQIVLARLLAPEAFGLLAIMLVVVEVANSISQSGLGMALIQSENVDDLTCDTALWLSLGIATMLYAAIFFAAPILASFYGMLELCNCLRVIALAIPFNAFNSIQRSILQKSMDFKAIFQSNTAAITLSGITGISAAIVGWGVWALVIQTLVQPVIACAVMAFQMKWHPSMAFDSKRARSLFSYGWKICVTGILGVVDRGIPELILGKVCNASDLGFFSQGRKWPAAGIHVVTNALQNVMFPAFSAMQGDSERLRAAIRKALAMGNFLFAPCSLFATVAAEPIVALLLGDKWLPCVPVFQFVFASNVVLMLQLVNLRAYMALGDSGLYLKLQVIKVSINAVAVSLVAVLTGDVYWTAFTVAACAIIEVPLIDLQPARRLHGVCRSEQLRQFLPILLVSCAASALAWSLSLMSLNYALQFVAQLIVFVTSYLLLAKLAQIQGRDECAQAIRSLVSKEND